MLKEKTPGRKIAMMFIDPAFGAPYVERLNTLGFQNVLEVSFGAKARDDHFANMRAYMWDGMKDWLRSGAIQAKNARLEADLTAPGYHINRQNQLVIEAKEQIQKRGVASPDDADSLCLTFAAPVLSKPITAEMLRPTSQRPWSG